MATFHSKMTQSRSREKHGRTTAVQEARQMDSTCKAQPNLDLKTSLNKDRTRGPRARPSLRRYSVLFTNGRHVATQHRARLLLPFSQQTQVVRVFFSHETFFRHDAPAHVPDCGVVCTDFCWHRETERSCAWLYSDMRFVAVAETSATCLYC